MVGYSPLQHHSVAKNQIWLSIWGCTYIGGSVSKVSACDAGDLGWIPWSGRCPGEGNDNPLHYSCLGNLLDRGAWQAFPQGVIRVGHNSLTKPPLPPTPLRESLTRKDDGNFPSLYFLQSSLYPQGMSPYYMKYGYFVKFDVFPNSISTAPSHGLLLNS